MCVYLAAPDDEHLGEWYDYEIEAWYPWGLPGVRCPVCTAWSASGLQFPSVDLSAHPNARRYRNPWPVGLDEFAGLAEEVRPLAPEGVNLLPGTTFGPIRGKVKGRLADLCWIGSSTLLLTQSALDRLQTARLPVPAYPTDLVAAGERLFDLELLPRARLAERCLPPGGFPTCSVCGRVRAVVPAPRERISLQAASIPEDEDLFRGSDLPTLIFAKERFVREVGKQGLRGAVFHPLFVE